VCSHAALREVGTMFHGDEAGGTNRKDVEVHDGMGGGTLGRMGNMHVEVTENMVEEVLATEKVAIEGSKWKKRARVGVGVSAASKSISKQITKRKATNQEAGGEGLLKKKRCGQGDDELPVIALELAGSATQPCRPK
jgi:hypothetical protein